MSQGLPLIVTDAGGSPEIIEHDTTGLLIPMVPQGKYSVPNISSLTEAMRELLDNPEKANRLSERAYEKTKNTLSSRYMAEQYCTLISKCK